MNFDPSRSLLSRLSNDELADLLAPDSESPTTRQPSAVTTRRCPLTGEWAPKGSAAAGRCLCCYTRFPRAA